MPKKNLDSKGQGSAKRILIIEDDKFLRELIARKLSDEGFEASEAVDGDEGIKMIKEKGNHFTFIKTFPREKQEIMFSTLERWLQIEIER